ncbi:hypothetical protein RR46_11362 [Papilio xuthus]|uniref:Uncharacterized protein n=1 Tax=Papilio xuthus TaxID=66420 RepID=A0A194PSB6_PAPXU|nr:hypothetical protein RR46_11362 [Papilio xuthus]
MTIGYHTGQEQLAYFAARARNVQSTTKFSGPLLRAGTEVERRTEPFSPDTTTTTTIPPETTTESVLGLEMYETRPRARTGSRDDNDTPIFIQYVDMTTLGSLPDLEDFPRKYNGRVRRAKNDMLSKMFWRPFKKTDVKPISPTVVSWMCCAMVLVVILVMIVVLTLYGITLGYHYAQKEIARFASGEEASGGRSGSELLREGDTQQQEVVEPLVRLVAVNRTQHETSGDVPGSFEGRTVSAQPLYLESTPTPLVVLESER